VLPLRLNEDRDARDGAGQAAAVAVKIDLSAEERRVLRLIGDELDATKYPLAPELKVLRDLVDKLRGEEEPKARGLSRRQGMAPPPPWPS
jgi:hypothetical protein